MSTAEHVDTYDDVVFNFTLLTLACESDVNRIEKTANCKRVNWVPEDEVYSVVISGDEEKSFFVPFAFNERVSGTVVNIRGKVQFLGEEHRCPIDCHIPTAWERPPRSRLYILDPAYKRKRQVVSPDTARSDKRIRLLHPGDPNIKNKIIDLTSSPS